VRLCGSSAALRETRVLVSSSKMSVRSSISFTSIRTERLFAHIGSHTRLLTASQGLEAIETQRTMTDFLGVSSNQWTARGSEASQESSNFAALPAMQDTDDTHAVSFTNKIEQARSIRFSSRFTTATTAGFQPTELCTTEYITDRMKIIDDSPGILSDQAITWIRATENVQFQIIDTNLSEGLEQAEKFAVICDLNESLATKVKNLEAMEPV